MNFLATLKQAITGATQAASKAARTVMNAVFGTSSTQEAVQQAVEEVAAVLSLRDAVAQILIPAMQENLIENESMFRGDLANSFQVVVTGNRSVEVVSSVPYASNVEYGSDPRGIGDEELDNLVEWAEFKFPNSENPEDIALAVAAAIEERGNRPHPYAAPALESTRDAIYSAVASQFAVDIRL